MHQSRKDVIGIPWLFVALTYGISWVLWILVALSGRDAKGSWLFVPYVLGGFSPSVVGMFLLYRTRPARERPVFWKSLKGKRGFPSDRLAPAGLTMGHVLRGESQ